MDINLIYRLRKAIEETEDAGREIYYAMTFLEQTNPARANLNLALKYLGITKPEDVGLSNTVLTRGNRV